jgi:hypothetical protein
VHQLCYLNDMDGSVQMLTDLLGGHLHTMHSNSELTTVIGHAGATPRTVLSVSPSVSRGRGWAAPRSGVVVLQSTYWSTPPGYFQLSARLSSTFMPASEAQSVATEAPANSGNTPLPSAPGPRNQWKQAVPAAVPQQTVVS